MNKKFLWIMVPLILTTAGLLIFTLWPKVELTEVKIASMTLSLLVAQEKGFFEKENLRVNWENISPEESVSALLAGRVDYATFYELNNRSFIETILKNAPIKTVILTARKPTYFLVARPGLELKDIKTIGIHSRHNAQHYLTLKFIETNNLEAEIIAPKTQNIIWTDKELQNSLLSNEIDAILSSPVSTFVNSQIQDFPILDTITYLIPSGLSVRNDKIEKNPEEIQKVIRALKQAMDFMVNNPKETKQIILEIWNSAERLDKTEESITAAVELYYPLLKDNIDRRDVPYDEGAELLIQIAKAGEFETLQEVEEQVVTQEELDKVFDFRFVK